MDKNALKLNEQQSEIGGGSRMNGKAALIVAITRLRLMALQYEALLEALPNEISKEADEGLWLLAVQAQR